MNTENQKCKGVVFSNRAFQDIKTETYAKDPVETGGLLLGYVLESGHWVVVEIIPPGNNSTHRYAYLEYDESLAKRVVDQIAGKYEQKLELLGLWHRHPGSMDFFSGTDDGTNIKFAEINPSYGAISGLVNIDPEFRMTMYHVDSPLNYTKVETFVGDDIIPAELLKLKEGVTFEEIDAIKKPKTRSEQQPAAPQQTTRQTTQQPRQTTPNREEPRRTTQSRENHEKPQVVIQRPETLTGVFKKLILEHTTAFCVCFVAVLILVAGLVVFSTGEGKKKAEEKAKQTEAQEIDELFNTCMKSTTVRDMNTCIIRCEAKRVSLKYKEENSEKVDGIIVALKGQKDILMDQEKERERAQIDEVYLEYFVADNPTVDQLDGWISRLKNLILTYKENKDRVESIIDGITRKKNNLKNRAAANAAVAAEDNESRKIREIYIEYLQVKHKTKNQCDNYIAKLYALNVRFPDNKNELNRLVEEIKQEKGELEKATGKKNAVVPKAEQPKKQEGVTEERKTETAKAEGGKAEPEQQESVKKGLQDTAGTGQSEQQQQPSSLGETVGKDDDKDHETPDADVAPAEPEKEKVDGKPEESLKSNPTAENEVKTEANNIAATGNGNQNKNECADLLKKEKDFQNAQTYYREKLLKHTNGGDCRMHLKKLKEVLKKLSDCEQQRKTVEDLIKNIDPDELKVVVQKNECDNEDAYKALETINTCNKCQDRHKYNDVLSKWKRKCGEKKRKR